MAYATFFLILPRKLALALPVTSVCPLKFLGISHDKAGFPRANKRVSENEYINRAVGLNLLHLHPPHSPFHSR
jgi:hypothetical protein